MKTSGFIMHQIQESYFFLNYFFIIIYLFIIL